MKNRKNTNKFFTAITAFALLTSGCSAGRATDAATEQTQAASQQTVAENDAKTELETQASAEPIVVTVGVVGDNKDEWDKVNENLASENITVKLVEFSDYNTPNRALNDGEIDLNAFQHYAFFIGKAERVDRIKLCHGSV